MNPDTIMGISRIDILLISVSVSIFSLFVTSYFAWRTKFKPAKLVGEFPYVIVWSFDGGDEGNIGDEYLVPFVWLSNIGAIPFLVGNIRLAIHPKNEAAFHLSPIHSVPLAAIEKPNSYSDFELIRLGEAPFCGFSVSDSGQWKNTYAFPINPKERALLKGNVKMVLEVRKLNSKKYKSVLTEKILFESEAGAFDWLRWAGMGGPDAAYYYKSE